MGDTVVISGDNDDDNDVANSEIDAAVSANDAEHEAENAEQAASEAATSAVIADADADAAADAANSASEAATDSADAAAVSVSALESFSRMAEDLPNRITAAIKEGLKPDNPDEATVITDEESGETQVQITEADKAPTSGHWLTRPLFGKRKREGGE